MRSVPITTHESKRERFSYALLISLAVHAVALAYWAPSVWRAGNEEIYIPAASSSSPVELVVEQAPEAEPEREPPEDLQYVTIPLPEEEAELEDVPDDARFADMVNRTAEVETVAANTGRPRPRSYGVADGTTQVQARRGRENGEEARQRSRVDAEWDSSETESVGESQEGDGPAPLDVAVSTGEISGEASEQEGAAESPTVDGEVRSVDLSLFNPTGANALDIIGTPGVQPDHIELPEADRTALNAYRSIYWSFFDRVKSAVEQEWDPVGTMRRYDPRSQLYGTQDRYTILSVTLNSDGSLRHAHVQRGSDLSFYDEEALRAIQTAGPYPNVPEGLKDASGHATFTFGFHLSFETRSARLQWLDRR